MSYEVAMLWWFLENDLPIMDGTDELRRRRVLSLARILRTGERPCLSQLSKSPKLN